MRTLMAMVLAAGLGATAAADDAKDPTAGTWVIESVTRDGRADEALKKATRVHVSLMPKEGSQIKAGGKYTVTPAPGSTATTVAGFYSVDGTASPMTIDMVPGGGRYKDQTLLGILKVEVDKEKNVTTLTVAFAEPGKDRPTAFESKPGSGVVLAMHKKK